MNVKGFIPRSTKLCPGGPAAYTFLDRDMRLTRNRNIHAVLVKNFMTLRYTSTKTELCSCFWITFCPNISVGEGIFEPPGLWGPGVTLHWRHNDHDGVSELNRLFRRRSKETSKLRVTGLCVGNSPVTGEFPAQMASNAENVSIWWRHYEFRGGELMTRPHLSTKCIRNYIQRTCKIVRFESSCEITLNNT